ncbi:MAG: DUF3617 family protein [Thermodesulfobacteriota bacterium]
MQDGKWEMTYETEMPGMPEMPPQTFTRCLTSGDAVPTDAPGDQCEITDQDVSGDTVSWEGRCDSAGVIVEFSGRVTYSGDTMKGETRTVIKAQGMEMTGRMKGRRVGECD